MSSCIVLDLGVRLMDAASFLDVKDLAGLNQVCLLNPLMMAHLREGAVMAALKKYPVWGSAQNFIARVKKQHMSPKQHARVLTSLRRTFFTPKAWEPWITKTSFCSLKVLPCTASFLEDKVYQKTWIVQPPYPAAVPISIGASRGQSFVVSLTVMAEGQVDDNICIGVEGANSVESAMVPVLFAPFSGQCFISLPSRGATMKALVLKPVDVVPSSVNVWIQVFESGDIRFIRQVDDQQPEDVGLLPSESLPQWIDEYFACVYYWGQTLAAAATVSVNESTDRVPAWLAERPAIEMDAVWESVDPEML